MLFKRIVLSIVFFLILTVIVVVGIFLFLISPKKIEGVVDVEISRGDTLSDTSFALEQGGVIRSAFAFQSYVLLMEGESSIVAGKYRFSSSASAEAIANRLMSGDFQSESGGITFPEGSTVEEMAIILKDNIPDFDVAEFLILAKDFEGYLFPDTYYLYSDSTPDEVMETMRDNFESKTSGITFASSVQNRQLSEIVTMASILEEEAASMDNRRIISGILWSRLEEGIPLQVDAAFLYIEELDGRNTYTLTKDDLAIESPYNTYTNRGLPPTPITNPGLESLKAAANPIYSDYVFYLSDTQGNMYYAETFEEHISNRKFLDY